MRQLSTAYGSAAETGNDILERLLDPFLDSISGNVQIILCRYKSARFIIEKITPNFRHNCHNSDGKFILT